MRRRCFCHANRLRPFRPKQCRLRRETGTAWSARRGYPSQRSVAKVTESVALLVPFVTFTVAVAFTSSGYAWVTVGFRFGAVSKIPSLLKSQLYRTPVFGGLSVAVKVTLTKSPPWHC